MVVERTEGSPGVGVDKGMITSQAQLTVAIPSRDRAGSLTDTLTCLYETQRECPIEVLVIDDGSVTPYERELEGLGASSSWDLRFIRTEGIGLNAGRNLAMSESRTEWVAFLDDDVYVAPGWARALIGAQGRRGVVGVAGRITVCFEAPVPDWLDEDEYAGYLSKLDLGTERRVGAIEPYGANFALSTAAWRALGGFFVGADRNGSSLVSGGETEFFQTLIERGHDVLYEPAAEVRHRFGAERLNLEYFQRRAFGQGVTDTIIDGGMGTRMSEARILSRALRMNAIAEVNRATGRRKSVADGIWRHYARGQLSGVLRHRETRRALTAMRSAS